jgi:Spy/CpxP family protein refolding chaperone
VKLRFLPVALIVSLGINAALGGLFLGTMHARTAREAEDTEHRHTTPRGWRQSALREKLGLDEVQVRKLETLNQDLDSLLWPTKQQLRDKRSEVIDVLKMPEPDETRLGAIFREMADLQVTVESACARHFLQVKSVLTPDQERLFFEQMEGSLLSRN